VTVLPTPVSVPVMNSPGIFKGASTWADHSHENDPLAGCSARK
jgi:hypothetical protein